MAAPTDDLNDVEAIVAAHAGFENDQTGRILARLIRATRAQRQATASLRDRVQVLEGQLPPPPGR